VGTFNVYARPTISTLTPSSAVVGSLTSPATLSVTVAGTNFVSGVSTVYWGTTALTTHYVSATSLTADVTSTQLASAGSGSITVQDGSATPASAASTFTVNPLPIIGSLTPSSAFAGAVTGPATLSVAVAGSNFISGVSQVYWGTTLLTTHYVSATSLTADVTSALLASAGSGSITVQDGSATLASSSTAFPVTGPDNLVLSSTTAAAGSTGFALTVTGTGFVSASKVYWGLTQLTTAYNSATSLTATVLVGDLASAGAQSITVQNGSSAATSPTPVSFTVTAAPTLTNLTPSVTHGAADLIVTATGTNFVTGSTVWFGSTALLTSFTNSTTLTATLPAGLITSAGPVSVTVVLPVGSATVPGGATTGAYTYTVN
jgi:hypothetical protein